MWWIKLTNKYTNRPIMVNMNRALTVRRDKGDFTEIKMTVGEPIFVTETLAVIFELIGFVDPEKTDE